MKGFRMVYLDLVTLMEVLRRLLIAGVLFCLK